MSHLAIRNTRRGKVYSNTDRHAGWELFELLKIIISILLTSYRWIKRCLENLCSDESHYSIKKDKCAVSSEEDQDFEKEEPGIYVVCKGVGLMAAYTGRRAVFAIYPANAEGLTVKSRGPAPLGFEYRRRKGMFLVGYVPRVAGTYKLRVSRFGKRAIGSPFVIRVDDPPPGYLRDFGAALWHERPPPPPLLSGVVDFVTEKMFLTSDGKLLKLKDGVMVPVCDSKPSKYVEVELKAEKSEGKQKNYKNSEQTETKEDRSRLSKNNDTRCISVKDQVVDFAKEKKIFTGDGDLLKLKDEVLVPVRLTKHSKSIEPPLSVKKQSYETSVKEENNQNYERSWYKEIQFEYSKNDEPKYVSAKNQVVARIESLLAKVNKESCQKNPPERYQFVSKALMKELSLSLKILNMLGGSKDIIYPSEMMSNCLTKQEFVIPEIKVTDGGDSELGRAGKSEDRFLSNGARRGGKLGWHWGDDAVMSGGACDDNAIRTRVLRASRVSSGATKWVCRKVGMSGLLGMGKGQQLSGVQLLHKVYRTPAEKDFERKKLNNTYNNETTYHSYVGSIEEKNNFQPHNDIISNFSPYSSSSENLKYEKKYSAMTSRINSNNKKIKKLSGNFRTLSLPDFNRFYSLSVQGLRKAKSCGDRSFKAMASSNLSLSLKNLFEKQQVHEKTKEEKRNSEKSKASQCGSTLVKMSHYASDYEKRTVQSKKSVDEWKKYWESMQMKQPNVEFGKECSLELTGIVDRGKALFEKSSGRDYSAIDNGVKRVKKKDKSKTNEEALQGAQNEAHTNGFLSFRDDDQMFTSPSPVSNKTAFQKAREIFEGKYDPGQARRSSTTEQFLSSLTKEQSEARRNSDSDKFNVNLMLNNELIIDNEPKLNSLCENLRDKRRHFVHGQLDVSVDSRERRNSIYEELSLQNGERRDTQGSGILSTLKGFSECLSQRNLRRRSESAIYMKSVGEDLRESRRGSTNEQYKINSVSDLPLFGNFSEDFSSLDNFHPQMNNGNSLLNGNTFSVEMRNIRRNSVNEQFKTENPNWSNNMNGYLNVQKTRKNSINSEFRLSNDDLQEMRRIRDLEISDGLPKIDNSRVTRRNSVSERFNVSSLKEDLQNGVTPDYLGVPHRISAVSCLGTVYDPQYPHAPITRRVTKDCNDNIHAGEFILSSNPDFV